MTLPGSGCADITYLPMRRGFLYMVAIMDWHTRKVLAWRISNTLDAAFCVDALNEAIHKFGPPEIMNTDQGSQFTSFVWTDRLRRSIVRISMDAKGRFLDNIFVERLWRSLKYECVYLHAWETGSEAKAGVRKWIESYNHKRSNGGFQLTTPRKYSVDAGSILLNAEQTISLTVGSARLTLRSDGSASLVTDELRMIARGDTQFESGGNMNLTAGGNVTVRGSKIELN